MESDSIGYLGRSDNPDRRLRDESISDYYKRLCKSESYIRYSNDGLGPLFCDPNTGRFIYECQYKQKYGEYPVTN